MPFWHASESEVPPADISHRIPLDCPVCGVHTHAQIEGYLVTRQNDWVRLAAHEMALHNYLVQCTRCHSGIFIIWSYGETLRGERVTEGTEVYPLPPRSAFETEKLSKEAIPAAILEDLRQAELAHAAGAHYGAGLLLRRACQSICRDKEVKENGGLKGQIVQLATSGIITNSLAQMAESIRIIGNELAHPDPNTPSVITRHDVNAGREFLNQLVRAIYVDPARAKQLKSALAQKGVKTS
jgi:Domain of unknown function (DUF4145)